MSYNFQRAAIALAWVGAIALRPNIDGLRAIGANPAGVLAERGADRAIGDLASAGLWVACLWLALASAAVAATQLPGLAGLAAGVLARHVAPRILRRALAAALGAGIAVTPALAVAEPAPAPSVSVTWPLSTDQAGFGPSNATPPSWPLDSPSAIDVPASEMPVDAVVQEPAATNVLVQPGDTLWSVAAMAMGPEADAAAIAGAWPQWYRANAAAIGSDPDLIRPGITLHAPALGDPS